MPKTRSKKSGTPGSTRRRVNYRQYDSSETEDENDFGMLATLLELFVQQKSTRKRRGRPPKRKSGPANCATRCQCCHCSETVPKRLCSPPSTRGRPKGTKTAKPSTSTKLDTSIELDSEEEVNPFIKETQTDNIKNKVDNFFKALESDEEELDKKPSSKTSFCDIPPEMKSKDFYTLLSDSDNEKDGTKQDIASKPSTITSSSLATAASCQTSNINNKTSICTDSENIDPKTNTEDLFAYVDNILNECNTVVDITDDKPKEDVPELSLEELKKKTDEILGSVASMIDDFNPTPKEPEEKVPKSPVKEAPVCPICLEPLGGTRQAMVTLCGHMFCGPCIEQVVKSTKKCPSCRKGVTKTKYHPVYL